MAILFFNFVENYLKVVVVAYNSFGTKKQFFKKIIGKNNRNNPSNLKNSSEIFK